jgi:hypothetical protein
MVISGKVRYLGGELDSVPGFLRASPLDAYGEKVERQYHCTIKITDCNSDHSELRVWISY